MAKQSGTQPRMIGQATEIAKPQRYCACCEKRLSGKVAWLELDQRTDTFHDFGGVPPEKSQGWFPFGMTCARNALNKAAAEYAATLLSIDDNRQQEG